MGHKKDKPVDLSPATAVTNYQKLSHFNTFFFFFLAALMACRSSQAGMESELQLQPKPQQ